MFSGIEELVNDVQRYKYNNNIPTPFACSECGYEERAHGMVFTAAAGLHQWKRPSNEMIHARMKARRSTC